MPTKSIIEIDVDDAAFRRFAALHEKYQKALERSPGLWAKASKEVQGMRTGFEAIAAAMLAQVEMMTSAGRAQRQSADQSERSAGFWRTMRNDARDVSSSVERITRSLLRWSTISGVVSGLVGAGSLFGIDRLAGRAAELRRTGFGLGLGPGEQQAFGVNFARLVEPEGFLSSVAGAKMDVTRRVGLIGAGLSPAEIGGSTAQTAIALLQHLKQLADSTAPGLYAQMIAARRLEQFVSPEDLARLRATSPEEFQGLIGRFGSNRAGFAIPPDVLRSWQELQTQLSRAGQSIENTFIRGLAPLAGPIGKLSEGFEKMLRMFLNSPVLEKWLEGIGKSLEDFAGKIGSDEFKGRVSSFVDSLDKIVRALGRIAGWLAFLAPEEGSPPGSGLALPGDLERTQPGEKMIVPPGVPGEIRPGSPLDRLRRLLDPSGLFYGGNQAPSPLAAAPTFPAPSFPTPYKDNKIVVEVHAPTGWNPVVSVNGLKN